MALSMPITGWDSMAGSRNFARILVPLESHSFCSTFFTRFTPRRISLVRRDESGYGAQAFAWVPFKVPLLLCIDQSLRSFFVLIQKTNQKKSSPAQTRPNLYKKHQPDAELLAASTKTRHVCGEPQLRSPSA